MEKNSNMPYSSSTTSEICEFTTEKNIKKILLEIDKILYSNTDEKYSIDNLDKLHNKAIAVCKKIIKKINDEWQLFRKLVFIEMVYHRTTNRFRMGKSSVLIPIIPYTNILSIKKYFSK